jgi:hypothetical protein
VKCSMFAWGCVVWYNVWCDAGGISCGWGDTVTCSAGGDTRARRGDTLSPTERGWYSIVRAECGAGRAGRVARAGGRQRAGAACRAGGARAGRVEHRYRRWRAHGRELAAGAWVGTFTIKAAGAHELGARHSGPIISSSGLANRPPTSGSRANACMRHVKRAALGSTSHGLAPVP